MSKDKTISSISSAKTKPAEIKRGNFDFDYWSKLAKQDSEAFEAARDQEINKHISNLKEDDVQERMRRLQWRIEMERKRSKNPLDAAARIYDMMWESVGQSISTFDELTNMLNPKANVPAERSNQHKNVLSFEKKNSEIAIAD